MEVLNANFAALAFAGSIALASLLQNRSCCGNKSNADVEISELWIYPIKSCKGIRVNSAVVTPRGFELDRWFMVVDENGKFVSQRSCPQMALVAVSVGEGAGAGRVLRVDAPGMKTLVVPTDPPAVDTVKVTVWDDECEAVVVDSEWFSAYLKVPGLRLVRFKEGFVRKTSEQYAPQGQTGFADGFPFLLASEESIAQVNAHLAEPVDNTRFRPNIIVRGAEAFAEDRWERLGFQGAKTLGTGFEMSVVKPCARCTIPNVDQETGVPSAQREPSRSMRAFRTGEAIGLANPKWQKDLFYGQNLDHAGQSGATLRVGGRVQVLAQGAPFLRK